MEGELPSVERWLDAHDSLESDDYMSDFGGWVYVLERPEELHWIDTLVKHPTKNRWMHLNEASSVFDIAEWTEDGLYAVIWMATNNAGGPVFFIPREIAEGSEHVLESIAMTLDGKDASNQT